MPTSAGSPPRPSSPARTEMSRCTGAAAGCSALAPSVWACWMKLAGAAELPARREQVAQDLADRNDLEGHGPPSFTS